MIFVIISTFFEMLFFFHLDVFCLNKFLWTWGLSMTYTNCSDLERVFLLNKCKAFILQLKIIISLKSSKLGGLQNAFEAPEQPPTCCVWYCLLPDADKKPDNVQPGCLQARMNSRLQISIRFCLYRYSCRADLF